MSTRPTSRIVAVALGLLATVAAGAELGFGAWFGRDPLDRLNLARDAEVRIEGTPFAYRRDHWGFRGPGLDPAKAAIVTLGGGTTSQPHLPDDLTWQAAMAAALAEQGRDTVIANAGIDGQTTVGHLRVLEAWLPAVPDLKPRFVIASVGVDDLRGPEPPEARLDFAGPWDRLRHQSAILRLLDGGRVTVRPAGDAPAGAAPDTGPYKDRLARMAELVHGMGAVPVFVTQPADGGPDAGLARVNAATLAVCRDKGLLCLDLAREVRFAEGDFADRLHNTPQGAAKVGRWLASKLAGLV